MFVDELFSLNSKVGPTIYKPTSFSAFKLETTINLAGVAQLVECQLPKLKNWHEKKSETSKYAICNISSVIRIGEGLETMISLLVDFRGFLFPIENFRSFNQRVAFK